MQQAPATLFCPRCNVSAPRPDFKPVLTAVEVDGTRREVVEHHKCRVWVLLPKAEAAA